MIMAVNILLSFIFLYSQICPWCICQIFFISKLIFSTQSYTHISYIPCILYFKFFFTLEILSDIGCGLVVLFMKLLSYSLLGFKFLTFA